jgi:tRNA-modifying protein YgfZ
MTQGYDALRTRAAVLDLSGRGVIYVAGEDRARLLHAISSNHIERLRDGEGCYAFFLNAQGKILADGHILCLHDRLLVDTEPETRDKLRRHIDKYIIAEDVVLEDLSETTGVIAVEGPAAAAVLAEHGMPVPESEYSHVRWESDLVARISSTGAVGFRFFLSGGRARELIGLLDLPTATVDDQRVVRLEHGRPRYGEDITEATLPQESGQMHAVSFQKGCYIGQEIVERIRARGQVHRRLEKLEYAAGEKPEAVVTSEAWSPALGRMVALGYVRDDGRDSPAG